MKLELSSAYMPQIQVEQKLIISEVICNCSFSHVCIPTNAHGVANCEHK